VGELAAHKVSASTRSQAVSISGNLSTGDLATTPGVFVPTAPLNICDQAGQPVSCSHGFVVKLPPAGDSLL